MFQQLLKYFTKRFAEKMGRSPQTASEFMSIQNDVVRYLNKTKGVPQGAPKPPFQGFTPKVIEGGKPKEGIGTLFKDSPERIAKIKADNKAAAERLRNKKKTVEDFRDDGDFDPGGMASGGIARLGYVGGKLVKGASWFIKNLRQAYDELIAGKAFTNIDPMKREQLKFEILAQIKQLEQGNPIPKDMLTYMRKDKRFKDMTKTRSTDPELYDVEEILLNPDVDQLKDIKKLEQKEMLEQFDVTGRTKQASGGLANILGV